VVHRPGIVVAFNIGARLQHEPPRIGPDAESWRLTAEARSPEMRQRENWTSSDAVVSLPQYLMPFMPRGSHFCFRSTSPLRLDVPRQKRCEIRSGLGAEQDLKAEHRRPEPDPEAVGRSSIFESPVSPKMNGNGITTPSDLTISNPAARVSLLRR
jgi:hypothetical protein